MSATPEQIKAATMALIEMAKAVIEAIKGTGEIGMPSGHLYAFLLSTRTVRGLDDYEKLMKLVVGTGLVRCHSHCYYYVNQEVKS